MSALLSTVNRENTVSLKERNGERSFRVYGCMCAGVRAKSEVALMNESETKRGNAHRLLSLSLQLPLISVRVSKRSHLRGLVAKLRRRPHGADQ